MLLAKDHLRNEIERLTAERAAYPHMVELEQQAVEDLGGEARVSALRREVLRIGL